MLTTTSVDAKFNLKIKVNMVTRLLYGILRTSHSTTMLWNRFWVLTFILKAAVVFVFLNITGILMEEIDSTSKHSLKFEDQLKSKHSAMFLRA